MLSSSALEEAWGQICCEVDVVVQQFGWSKRVAHHLSTEGCRASRGDWLLRTLLHGEIGFFIVGHPDVDNIV